MLQPLFPAPPPSANLRSQSSTSRASAPLPASPSAVEYTMSPLAMTLRSPCLRALATLALSRGVGCVNASAADARASFLSPMARLAMVFPIHLKTASGPT